MDVIQTIYLILIILLIGIITFYCNVRLQRTDRPPGPWSFPIVGYLPWVDSKTPHLTLTKLSQKFGPIYGLHLGNIYTVVLSDPKLIKTIFMKDSACGRAPLYLTHGLMKGCGLICAQGDLWKDQRKFVHNSLRHLGASKVSNDRKNLEKLIVKHAQDFVGFVKSQGRSSNAIVTLNPLDPLRHSLGSLINLLVFGRCWARDDEIWLKLQYLQEEGTKLIGVAGAINFLPFLKHLPKQKQAVHFLTTGMEFTHELYKKIIADEIRKPSPRPSLLQLFLEEREKRLDIDDPSAETFYNDQQFRYLLADIFGASLDTTLTTLRWFLLYLSTDKNLQEEIRNQLKNTRTDDLTINDLSSFPLIEAAIAETQRIRSVIPTGIPHGALEEIIIDGFTIPKGAMIIPLQWAVHMNSQFWNEPDQFKPERFIDEEGKFRKSDAFIPFQLGKRMCVGDDLAKMFLFIFGATIVKNFEISCENPDFEGESGITLTPKTYQLIFNPMI